MTPALGTEIEHVMQMGERSKQRGRDHRALPRPPVTGRDDPVLQDPRPQPFPYQADDALDLRPDARRAELASFLIDFPLEKGSDIRVKNEVHALLSADPHRQSIQRIVLSTLPGRNP